MANEERDESFAYANQLVTGSVLPMTMQAAIELGVFKIIVKAGPGAKLSASEIAAQVPATKNKDAPIMLDRILRLLVSHGVVECSLDDIDGSQRLYGQSNVSRHFVPNEDGVSLGPLMALIQDKVFLDSWSQLKEAIIEGGVPFDRAHGTHAFEYPRLDPRFNEIFNTAMYNLSTLVIQKILEAFNGFKHIKQLVDVGGSLGNTLKAITTKYPHVKGINFDLPHVIQHAPEYPGMNYHLFSLSLEGRAREWYWKLPRGSSKSFEQMCQEFAKQFRGAMTLEDDMMELTSMKQGEEETLREFIKRFHRAVLDLGAFNHPQALRGLKEGVKIGCLWYNMRSPAIQSYSVAYEQAKRNIGIEEKKVAKIKTDQLEGLKRKEKKALPGNGPIKRKDHHASGNGVGGWVTSYQPHQRPPQYQRSRMQPPRSSARDSW
ncbi:Flavone 3'-O-methyltransferase 1 [Citrus sinensis]|uniref:Flavone 3'-O-methyltransferase 1 n=1 Tax=Citrus sinensis TaxID=2711 RepID=A0ACB8M6B0_CITSI|nr:Flavone 3'-O-methyltransferase 1 [Citrus sinensis]